MLMGFEGAMEMGPQLFHANWFGKKKELPKDFVVRECAAEPRDYVE